jgi:STE24 endopeptidase
MEHENTTLPTAEAAEPERSEPQRPVRLDAARQATAQEYAGVRRRLMLIDLALGAVYLIVWVVFGWHVALREWVAGLTSSSWLQVAIYALAFGAPYFVLDLPLSYYSGFVLPHHYDQSTQDLKGWIGDQLKGLALALVLGGIVLEVIYWLLRAAPTLWWVYAAGVMLLFTVVLSILSPVLIAPLFFKFSPLEDEDLAGRLMKLAERAGTQVRGVYCFDMSSRTKSANAALMGMGSTRRIVLGDTLLDEFSADEIETVLAHELAHHVHNDIPLLTAVNTVLILVSFYVAHLVLDWAVGAFGLNGPGDPATLPIFGLVMGAIGLISMPLGNAISRWREGMADHYALEETRMPDAFADAMTRLANQNLGEYDPESWVVFLLYSHPPLRDRVEAARRFAASS